MVLQEFIFGRLIPQRNVEQYQDLEQKVEAYRKQEEELRRSVGELQSQLDEKRERFLATEQLEEKMERVFDLYDIYLGRRAIPEWYKDYDEVYTHLQELVAEARSLVKPWMPKETIDYIDRVKNLIQV